MTAELPELVVADPAAWGAWLGANGTSSPGVWLVLARKGTTSPTRLTYDGALEEALCHGWVDGQKGRRDEATFRQRFTPRRRRSTWSRRNVDIVARLHEQGRMQDAGRAQVAAAQADGRWAAAYDGAATIAVPADLAAALAAEPAAQEMFGRLSGANRYAVLYRLQAAKRPDTRARRLEQFVAMLARGETLHPQPER